MPLPDALGHEAPLADAPRVEKCRERLAHHERRGLEVRGLLRGVDHVGRAHGRRSYGSPNRSAIRCV